ncbi:chorismate mutase [Nonomuraea jabiensis]|uniref:Chorismate mutase n=1 Tax=Nonomuraea jabiensis TaxID=882448 RepID=A0A7W9G9V0_9ACTN|nr:chorismate mutase [Nonomuraea jabiensis]MBB5779768.1 chorismate mutase [Nonomuraea jabiensis]
MSSTLERRAVAVGGTLVGEGPAVVIGGRVDLRAYRGEADAYEVLGERATLVEPYSAADLPAIAERADAVVVGSSWTRDIPLVRSAAGLGLPVVVERRPAASLEEWLELADYCAREGDGRVLLCEGGRLDLGMMRAARAVSGRPVLADVSRDAALSAAAVAAGADGLVVSSAGQATPAAKLGTYAGARTAESSRSGTLEFVGPGSLAEARQELPPATALRAAEEAVTVVGALVRPEAPGTLPECREAIDRVDAALATLLERRAALAGIVQRIKPVGGFAGRDLARERALVARMALRAPSLGEARLAPIMNAVIEAGLHLAEERSAE